MKIFIDCYECGIEYLLSSMPKRTAEGQPQCWECWDNEQEENDRNGITRTQFENDRTNGTPSTKGTS